MEGALCSLLHALYPLVKGSRGATRSALAILSGLVIRPEKMLFIAT